jgi:hypothetical protein
MPSLNNSTSHCLFLVCCAGGDLGDSNSAVGSTSVGWVLSVSVLAVDVQTVMVIERQQCQPYQLLLLFVAVVCVRKQ